jgi:AraC-like DNA-binding protein
MSSGNIFVTDLSTSKHIFNSYHFCRGNSNKRKSRIGIIIKGRGAYIYLNNKLNVSEGDVVFIPENIYCYSEWRGNPEIEVIYISCFMHYENFKYAPQLLDVSPKTKNDILQISKLLATGDELDSMDAYSMFYRLLKSVIVKMKKSDMAIDKTLQSAIGYITDNWDKDFSISELAKKCYVSESTLYHLFQRELGQTPISFLNSIRINIAIEYLENSNYSIATISQLVGFNSENHFRKIFTSLTGTTPLKFRKRT